jgi:LysR family transcriptional regulator, glycine cleavage system transcriptional activator
MPDAKTPARLPSLNALRAFVAAGRHLNLKRAAAELFVTPSALSHQIRELEAQLGVQLFRRTGKGLTLTAEGGTLLPGLAEAFDKMSASLALLKADAHDNDIAVSMLSTFAMRWFIPRLSTFQKQRPDINIRISTSVKLVDFSTENIDCAIRFGDGDWPGLHADLLFAEQLVPVCSPNLPTPEKPLNTPDDLKHHTLLHAQLRADDWRIWLHAAGVTGCDAEHGPVFETRNFAIQAAIDGLGVAIVDPHLVTEELRNGRLIQPFAELPISRGAYYLVYPDRIAKSERFAAFRTWLLSEAQDK